MKAERLHTKAHKMSYHEIYAELMVFYHLTPAQLRAYADVAELIRYWQIYYWTPPE